MEKWTTFEEKTDKVSDSAFDWLLKQHKWSDWLTSQGIRMSYLTDNNDDQLAEPQVLEPQGWASADRLLLPDAQAESEEDLW